MNSVPDIRLRAANQADVNPDGEFVLYWMIAFRRTRWNYSLDRAIEWARELGKPLVVLEALRCGYRWASDRLHQFVVEGMRDNAADLADRPATYYPYLEPKPGAGRGLLAAWAKKACVVVSDDFPCFFLPRMIDAAAGQIPVRFELVDSNGVLPLRAADKVFARAVDFRRFLQKHLRPHLAEHPRPQPLSRVRLPRLGVVPAEIRRRWPAIDPEAFLAAPAALDQLPIDHQTAPGEFRGGSRAAGRTLDSFLRNRLDAYGDGRNHPDDDAASGLSPYLHFGHLSSHEVFAKLTRRDDWTPDRLAEKADGSRAGWWGASEPVEAFLDQLITWRELGYNLCALRDDYGQYESLPDWAQQTLADHADDPREFVYSLDEFERAATHDPLWNAAQRQLARTGRMHNYLRMLWGKKILEWSAAPRDALEVMIELNNKYALDGRNPNSYSGIFWVLGRYDRPWGPERPIFGKIRYMSSDNTARKLRINEYLEQFGEE